MAWQEGNWLVTLPRAGTSGNGPIDGEPRSEPFASGATAYDRHTLTLEDWQSRLAAHFDTLARQRKAIDWPVFALEHGLTEVKRKALAETIRNTVGIEESLTFAPLAWVVYAAEAGYQYAGEEYWRTFTQTTPKWQDTHRNRQSVRGAFRTFADRYGGATPAGAWAEHFCNIAWPITHSILPRDLQRQLAKLLYDTCRTFREETFASAEKLGRHLGGLSGATSARFRQFAKDSALLGQIAFALLLHDSGAGKSGGSVPTALIHGPTLERIIADLSGERDARDWLVEARSVARFRVRGLSTLPFRLREVEGNGNAKTALGRAASGDDLQAPLSRPRFLLRQAGANRWSVWIQFPNLTPALVRMPRARDTLARVHGRIGGPGGPILTRERILLESWPGARLSEWPVATGSLLHFEGAPPELRALLDAAFRIPPGNTWLFIVGADGQARELNTRVLRPGESYLLLQRTRTSNPAAGLAPAEILCAGVYGLRIDVPTSVSEALVAVLNVLGLEIAETLEVWPAGLPVPDWSGDGTVEVLAAEPLMLAVRSDRVLTALIVAVDDALATIIPIADNAAGQPEFVIVPPLSEGRHRLTMTAVTAGDTNDPLQSMLAARHSESRGLAGVLDILVRAPRPTGDGGATGALSFSVYPRSPSLEDLWEDRCELHVSAPGAQQIRCRVTLTSKGTAAPIAQKDMRLPAPLNTATWREAFGKQVRKVIGEEYDEAYACVLDFNAGSLGRARVVAERDFTPLRWMIRNGGRDAVLIDSRGDPEMKVVAYTCEKPDVGLATDAEVACSGLQIPTSGVLLCAQSGSSFAAVVAVPPHEVTSFADLAHQPIIRSCRREALALERVVRLAATWESARLGAVSVTAQRRDAARNALHTQAIEAITGERWAAAEAAYHKHGNAVLAVGAMRSLVSSRADERRIIDALSSRAAQLQLANCTTSGREQAFIGAVTTFVDSAHATQVASFAIRLATSASAAVAWTFLGDESRRSDYQGGHRQESISVPTLRVALERLLAAPIILRAARLAVVTVDAEAQTQSSPAGRSADHHNESLSEWNWV